MLGEPIAGHPWFNEPGYADNDCPGEIEANMTPHGKACSEEYNREIRRCTMLWAMIDVLRNPPMAFEDVSLQHFRSKRVEIAEQVTRWEMADGSAARKLQEMLSVAKGVHSYETVIKISNEYIRAMEACPVPRYIAQVDAARETITKAQAAIVKTQEEEDQKLEQQAEKMKDNMSRPISTSARGDCVRPGET